MPDKDIEIIDKETRFRRNKIPDYQLDGMDDLLYAWREHEERNIYPFSGGWAEQPAHIIDIFREFDYVFSLFNERAARREKARQDARALRGRR